MDEYVHLQNLILLKKRLAEPQDESQRTVLLKLLADEEARVPSTKKSS
ncbi:hypothetical protein LQG66_31990 [Bradyrhizobium ontarionense]|uniref:Uncharacterized protein n=1 Tax=Bradyrhizobium ontarionense TaxID=2898149 RepID=A0ABY3R9R9_9BRAD|nr:hypothetical protein [Bradyrhizobium sp. A19]UFZ03777.1 hypothetical protein LQG66_31990 [Bradyrhizobium sp. A19]